MKAAKEHISVCICSYKRQKFLKQLLEKLGRQDTEGLFSYSIVVSDNDCLQSAQPVVSEFVHTARVPVSYCVEPRQNIALARNKALEYAVGDFVAFVDDDEMPVENWLVNLWQTCHLYEADGVLGSARPKYEGTAPSWVVKGRFWERASYPTGFVIDWRKGRTGNLLLKRTLFNGAEQPFRPNFLTGEDQDFFRRMIETGHVFVWSEAAITEEIIPAVRWKRSFMLRRALLRGQISINHPSSGRYDILKSVVAISAYTISLPLLLMMGQHKFMKYMVKICDHLGRLLASLGIKAIKDKYVVE